MLGDTWANSREHISNTLVQRFGGNIVMYSGDVPWQID